MLAVAAIPLRKTSLKVFFVYTRIMTEHAPTSQSIKQHYHYLEERLALIPELEPAFAIFNTAPDHVVEIYLGYTALIKDMAALTEADQLLIVQSQRKLAQQAKGTGSASTIGANHIIEALGSRKRLLIELADASTDSQNPFYASTVDSLATKLEGGHRLKMNGKIPSDHDPASLKVIWGHTVITGNEALLHFVTGHYLGQYFAEALQAAHIPFANQKDFFVNALTDVVILNYLKSGYEDPLFNVWATPKQAGGMGWITENRLKSYAL